MSESGAAVAPNSPGAVGVAPPASLQGKWFYIEVQYNEPGRAHRILLARHAHPTCEAGKARNRKGWQEGADNTETRGFLCGCICRRHCGVPIQRS